MNSTCLRSHARRPCLTPSSSSQKLSGYALFRHRGGGIVIVICFSHKHIVAKLLPQLVRLWIPQPVGQFDPGTNSQIMHFVLQIFRLGHGPLTQAFWQSLERYRVPTFRFLRMEVSRVESHVLQLEGWFVCLVSGAQFWNVILF